MPKVLRQAEHIQGERWLPAPAYETTSAAVMSTYEAAMAIHQEAKEEAERLMASAQIDAELLRQQGYAEGLARGLAQGQQVVQEQVAELERHVAEINAEREAFFTRASDEVLRLSIAIAERILAQQLTLTPAMMADMVQAALRRIREREKVTVHVHPDDITLMQQALPAIRQEVDEHHEISLLEDPRMEPGGAVIETPDGSFDLRLSSQLEAMRHAINAAMEESDATAGV